jgi:isoleucyl-tRNA synthetase
MSPVTPFISEWLYQNLNDVVKQEEISVHISFYPSVEETAIDKQLERRMDVARIISSIVLRVRNQIDVNVRQPLARIILPMNKEERMVVDAVKEIILDEVNVKNIEYVDDDSGIVSKTAKPNYPVLGKRLGKQMKNVAAKISALGTEEITRIENEGAADLQISENEIVRISLSEIEIQRTGLMGWSVETEKGITVAVDTELTSELIFEGLSREFVNRIQNMRKEANFEVTDRIVIGFDGSDQLKNAVKLAVENIKTETLAEEISTTLLEVSDFVKTWDIEGDETEISIRRTINN